MEPITMVALGAGALYLLTRKKNEAAFVEVKGGSTGRLWLSRIVSITGDGENKQVLAEVWAPAGSYGPHHQTKVVTYNQTGSDKSTRRVVSYGPNALPQMVTDAGLDFGIKKQS